MNTDYRKYNYRKYEYGWMVFSTNAEGADERMEMCYANEAAALSHVMGANQREPQRYAEAVRREEEARRSLVIPDSPYYSITGYYGD